jgi:hypothetical protein
MGFKLWNKTDDLYPPGGGKMTPEQAFEKYPWARNPAAQVIVMQGDINCGVFMSLSATRSTYELQGMTVPEGATDEEVAELIWEWEHRPSPVPDLSNAELLDAAALIMGD